MYMRIKGNLRVEYLYFMDIATRACVLMSPHTLFLSCFFCFNSSLYCSSVSYCVFQFFSVYFFYLFPVESLNQLITIFHFLQISWAMVQNMFKLLRSIGQSLLNIGVLMIFIVSPWSCFHLCLYLYYNVQLLFWSFIFANFC